MHQQNIKQKAIDLRKAGYSYNYIAEYVPVTKSTLSEWLRDIPFFPNKHTIDTIGNARIASGVYKHGIMMESFREAEDESKKLISNLSDRDIMMLGLGIYIGEGAKTVGITRIINSDPKIIKLMIKWFKISFGVTTEQFKVRLYIYPDNNEKECIEYWSKQIGIPRNNFHSSYVDVRTNKKSSNQGKLPFGTAHMSVLGLGKKKHGKYLHRLIMALINRVL
jgi:transcriptional regulator with XRE-family HTH domain